MSTWREVSGRKLWFERADVSQDYDRLVRLMSEYKPEAIVHFAEQRAAPYSMKSSREKRYTVNNNLVATHNVLCAIVESGIETHLVHLGTMGVYGYGTAGMKVPEGYLPISVDTEEGRKSLEILYPPNPGSVYHMTKAQDQLFFAYYTPLRRESENPWVR